MTETPAPDTAVQIVADTLATNGWAYIKSRAGEVVAAHRHDRVTAQSKQCTCGCGETYFRPPGLRDAKWKARKFKNDAHRWGRPSSTTPAARKKARKPAMQDPAPRPIASVPVEREVWRPASWGGPYRTTA